MEGLIFTEVAKVFIMMFLVMYFSASALDEDASIFKDDQPSNDKCNVIERYLKPRRCIIFRRNGIAHSYAAVTLQNDNRFKSVMLH